MLLTAALQPGHEHGSVGIMIGPLALRVLLLAAAIVVAAFALLRGFTGPPRHRTAVWVWSAAAAVVVVELLLSGGLDVSQRIVPLILAATAAPAYAIFSRDRRWAALRGALRTLAPLLFTVVATLAAVEFARAWLTVGGERRITLLHTGVTLAGVAVSWLLISHPRTRPATVGLYAAAAGLAILTVPGAANVAVLRNYTVSAVDGVWSTRTPPAILSRCGPLIEEWSSSEPGWVAPPPLSASSSSPGNPCR